MPTVLLVDNGSSQPDSTLQLRQIANNLGIKSGQTIYPVSLQHADKISADDLAGESAQTFYKFISEKLSANERDFILLPLFFGNSKALTRFVPEQMNLLEKEHGEFRLRIANTVYPLPDGEVLLTKIIHDHIISTANTHQLPLKNIVLVDHGSPAPEVTAVRQHLVTTVQERFTDDIKLEQAVMERRAGKEYDFNGALLENWLIQKAQAGERNAIVILMFFLAGRHAGNNGDIVQICDSVMNKYPEFQIRTSPLIGEHDELISILHSRLLQVSA